MSKLIIQIPCLNEEGSLADTIAGLRREVRVRGIELAIGIGPEPGVHRPVDEA